MNGNAELLNFIYQNSQMGIESIETMIDDVKDAELKEHLCKEIDDYSSFHQRAKDLLNIHGYDEKGLSSFERIKTYIMVNMQTANDKSTSHLAEMLILGSNMGVVDAIKNQNKYPDADKNILGIMRELQKFEENNVERLKMFL